MFFVMFGVGVGFVILSLILGEIDFECGGFGFLKPTLIAVFLIVAGGLGLLLSPNLAGLVGTPIIIAISFFGGLSAAGAVHRFIIVPLEKAQNTSTFDVSDTIGIEAKVVSPIPQGGYGKIKYNVSGSVVTNPAKSESGSPIANGETVEIIYVKDNTYYVRGRKESASTTASEALPGVN